VLDKSSEGLKSARQKRSMEDADDEMEASSATETDTQGADEDSAAKRPKTGDNTGMIHCYLLPVLVMFIEKVH